MDRSLALFLDEEETQRVIELLERADRNHLQWLRRVHSGLITGRPAFADDILDPEAHQRCKFGHWYYHEAAETIRDHPHFTAIESLHRKMHEQARLLACKSTEGRAIREDEYAHFMDLQKGLCERLVGLREELQVLRYSFDALTGTLNRQACEMLLNQEFARVSREQEICCLSLMDIDHFKAVNDNYGHMVGDHVIKTLSGLLREQLRPYDTICRYGGEEFLISLPNTDLARAEEILDRLRREIAAREIAFEQGDIRVTVSFGLASLDTRVPLAESVRRADEALYAAKAAGRNCIQVASPPA
jgi:diguanylate cyclase (GGDEF)-like protein